MKKPLFAALIICLPFNAQAQPGKATNSPVFIPFVGCKPDDSDFPTPSGKPVSANLPTNIASKLAAYSTGGTDQLMVLAPRGWNCTFRTMGDAELAVSPNDPGNSGVLPLVKVRFNDVGTPSNWAKTYGLTDQLFPKIFTGSDFVSDQAKTSSDLRQLINSGEVERIGSADNLKYLNDSIVEYKTPPEAVGLGSQFLGPWDTSTTPAKLIPTPYVISGFVGLFFISNFKTPFENLKGLLTVGVRLPDNLSGLCHYILDYSEKDFEKSNHLPG